MLNLFPPYGDADGWSPGVTMDIVVWRNVMTGETHTGSSSDRPPAGQEYAWEIARDEGVIPGQRTRVTMPPTPITPTQQTNYAPLLLAVAAAYFLGA